MLTILICPPGGRGSAQLMERLRPWADRGERALLLVPESDSHAAERELLAACGSRAGEYAGVTTFSKLTEDVLERTGALPETLDDGGRVLTMHRALTAARPGLTYYRKAGRPQLTARLVELAGELQSCAVTPEMLLRAEAAGPKIRDLGLIYGEYLRLCREGRLDPSQRIDLARERLEASGLVQGAHVFIRGFEGFTAQKRAMVEAILAQAADMTVLLEWEPGNPIYAEQRQTCAQLRRMADSRGIPFREETLSAREEHKPAGLRELSSQLFCFQETGREGREGLDLYTLADPGAECRMAAAVLRQRALEGVRLREMAVVCGDLESYGPELIAAFEEYGIPLFCSEKTDILQKNALAGALGSLEALEDGLSWSAVLSWLRRGLAGLDRDEVDRLENYCAQWNIGGEGWFSPFTMPTCGYGAPAPDEEARLADINVLRARTAELLTPFREALRQCRDGADFARALQEHLRDLGLEERLSDRCIALQKAGRGRESAETAQLYHILQDALDQFAGTMAGVTMDRHEFVRLLRLMLRQYEVSSIPPSLDSVLAVSFERMSGRQFRHVVILGAREGLFPVEKPSESLLSESERTALEGCGVILTQKALERAWQQQCALCRAVSAAQESLTVLAPRRLRDGSPAALSYLFRRMALLRKSDILPGDERLRQLELTAARPLFSLACAGAAGDGSPECRMALEMADGAQRDRLDRLRRYAVSPRGPIRDGGLIRELYGGRIGLTATRVERVSACRFSYFMQYGLRAAPRREARFGAPEIGTFVHAVVEKAIRTLCETPGGDLRAITARYVNDYQAALLRQTPGSARLRALFRQAGELAIDIVQNVWDEIQAGDFRPVSFELNFDRRGDLPPLTLEEGGLRVTVGGKIDRVDGLVRGDTLYLKVVDYKTGSKEFRLSDVLYGLNLQMFLYLLMLEHTDLPALERVLGVEGIRHVEPCGALYIPAKSPFVQKKPGDSPEEVQKALDSKLRRLGLVRDDRDLLEAMEHGEGKYRFLPVTITKNGFGKKSALASREQLARLLWKTEDTLRRIARQIGEGDVECTPYRKGRDETPCTYCDYRDACHFDTNMKKDVLRFLPKVDADLVDEILQQEEQKTQNNHPEGGENHEI